MHLIKLLRFPIGAGLGVVEPGGGVAGLGVEAPCRRVKARVVRASIDEMRCVACTTRYEYRYIMVTGYFLSYPVLYLLAICAIIAQLVMLR